jgi:HD domain
MTHRPGWTIDEPCPNGDSWDITEYKIRPGTGAIRTGWDRGDCGHDATWIAQPGDQASHAVERRLLAVMPLHAITTLYGEKALRERFALETARLDSTADRRQVNRALQLADGLHALDRRQREPYVNHLLRVALRIICHYETRDTDVICAALLHDAVEDHADDLSPDGQAGAFTALAAAFGSQVADLVAAVTNPVWEPGCDKDDQYREHVTTSLASCPHARVIKVSDFTDNGAGLIHTIGPKVARLARKYAPLVPVLADLITQPDTPLPDHVKARVLDQLSRAGERFAAITINDDGR